MDKREQLLNELAKIDLMIEMELAKTNYPAYVKYVHRYDKEFKMAKFQEYICNCIDKLLNDELLNDKGVPYEGMCISQMPQSGKSRCITETLPSYFLGKFPYNHAIEISYGEDLAVRFGRRNKQKIEEFGRQLFGIELSKHSSSALEFEINKTNGGMISRGLGGQITGSPADCFPKGTMVATEIGEIEISQLLGMVNTPRILAYDHHNDKIVLRNIIARRVKHAKEFTIITTSSGREIRSTTDHRYYKRGKGYTQAQLLRRNDILYSIKQEACHTPQIEHDTISTVESISGESIKVYDIQIEETHNFFANGILVHNCILVDDPYKNRQEADSPIYNKFVMDEWYNTVQTRASAKCKYVIVHTRWNEDDLIGTLLNIEPDKYFEISFPAIAEQDELETSGRKIGEALLPEAGKDLAWLLKKRESYEKDPTEGGIRAWNALFQQRPSSLEGNMIKREYWQRFDLTLEMQRQGFFPVKIQSWDLALKDTADPVAGGVWGKRGANCYIVDHKGGRMDIQKSMDSIKELTAKHPDATAKLIEDKANGPAAIRLLRDTIHGLIPVNPGTKSKAERVNVVLPLFMSSNVFIPSRIEVSPGIFKNCEWANEIIEQCAAFKPDKKVQRDDEVDQTSQALSWLMWRDAKLPAEQKARDDFGLWNRDDDDSFDLGEITQEYIDYGVDI